MSWKCLNWMINSVTKQARLGDCHRSNLFSSFESKTSSSFFGLRFHLRLKLVAFADPGTAAVTTQECCSDGDTVLVRITLRREELTNVLSKLVGQLKIITTSLSVDCLRDV